MIFQYGYCHEGRTFWPNKTSEFALPNIKADLKALTAFKAQGVDWFGLTHFDDKWQTTGVVDELYPFRLQLDLASQVGRVVARTQPWLFHCTLTLDNVTHSDEWISNYAKMFVGLNFKRVAWSIMPEPAQLCKVISHDPFVVVPYEGEEFIKQREIQSRRLETWYDHIIPLIRSITGPDLTLFLSAPGWGHLVNYEYLDLVNKYTNTVRCHDAYFMPWDNIEKCIEDGYNFYRLRGEKLILTETGIADRSKIGTLDEENVLSRVRATCTRLKIPYSVWLGA